MVPPFSSTQEIIRWVKRCKRPEEIDEILSISDGTVAEAVFRYAPRKVLSLVSVRDRLENVPAWQAAPGWLMALADNEELDGLISRMLFEWAHKSTREVPVNLLQSSSRPNGEVAAMQLVRRLEMSGHTRPNWLMDDVRASIKSWRKKTDPNVVRSKWASARDKEEEEKGRTWHAALLLADWVSLRPEDAYAVFRALKEDEVALAKLMRHPSTSEKVALYILKEKMHSLRVLNACFSRTDLMQSPLLREVIVGSDNRVLYLQFFPHATSEEFIEMMIRDGLRVATQMTVHALSGTFALLKERAPTPKEAAAIIRGISGKFPEATLWEAQRQLPPESLVELTNEDFLPLLGSERAEMRLEGQRLWAQVERAKQRRAEEAPFTRKDEAPTTKVVRRSR